MFRLGLPRLALGEGIAPIGGEGPWWPVGAVFDADIVNGRFYWNGQQFDDEAAFLTAIGGSKSGDAYSIGSYHDPSAFNLIQNGNFVESVDGWSAWNAGSTIEWASGELKQTSTGNLNGVVQPVAGLLGRAFYFQATARKETSGSTNAQPVILSGAQGNSIGTGIVNSTSPQVHTGYASFNADPVNVGFRNSASPGTGSIFIDNVSAIECWPFEGWDHAGWAVAVKATTGVEIANDEVLFQADPNNAGTFGTDRDRVRIYRRASDDHVLVDVRAFTSATVAFDLGAVADDTAFEVALSVAQNDVRASLNGGLVFTDTSNIVPGASHMRIGRQAGAGLVWTGTVERVTVF